MYKWALLPACLPAYYTFVQKLKELETMQLSSSTTTTTVFKPSLLNTPETMQKGLEGIEKASQMGFLTLQKRKKETDAADDAAAAADDDDDGVADVKKQNNSPKKIRACRTLRIWIPTCKDLVPNQEPWWCDCENQPSLSSFLQL
jgi:hypothetical protein